LESAALEEAHQQHLAHIRGKQDLETGQLAAYLASFANNGMPDDFPGAPSAGVLGRLHTGISLVRAGKSTYKLQAAIRELMPEITIESSKQELSEAADYLFNLCERFGF
jgi:hypothetical protein